MNIGYACLTVGVPGTKIGAVRKTKASSEKLLSLIEANLEALRTQIEYNCAEGIKLFRISSDIIPFGSSPVNKLPWWEIFASKLQKIGSRALERKIRLSMHPGQYSVLNSPRRDVAYKAVLDLFYHARFLDSLGLGPEHKIVLHIGGVYSDKDASLKRFASHYKALDGRIKNRLVIENDERSYAIDTVLETGLKLSIPVVFDNLHHLINPPGAKKNEQQWIAACRKSWKRQDGPQKIHYSQQAGGKRAGAHTKTIAIEPFLQFCGALKNERPDIMLEVKDKNLSALKCINCTETGREKSALKREQERYEYFFMERSQSLHGEVKALPTDKEARLALPFYLLVEKALATEVQKDCALEAARRVWENLNNEANAAEQHSFEKTICAFNEGRLSRKALKSKLLRLAEKYGSRQLISSYYFYLG